MNSGSSEDSGETSGGGGGGTTSGPAVNDPTTWEVEGTTLSVPSGAVSISASDIAAVQGAQEGKTITSIALPASVTTIGANAFSSCTSLTDINLRNVTTIGDNAFKNTKITGTPDLSSATTIGASAFEGTNISGELNLSSATTIGDNAFNRTKISGELNLSSATQIGEGAFKGCTGITSVTFTGGANVGTQAFLDCKLTSVTFNGSATIGVTAFGASSENTSLTTVTFGGPTTVGDGAFYKCTALKTVSGLDMVTSIGDGAFAYAGLTSVTLGAGLTTLEPSAFNECDSLTSADLSACTKLTSDPLIGCTIGEYTFRVSEGKSTALALKLPDEASSWTVGKEPFLNRGTVTLYYKNGEADKDEILDKFKDEGVEVAVAPAADFPNGSSGGSPGGQSLLSSFSAFRDLLS